MIERKLTGRQVTAILATALFLLVPAIALSQNANPKSTLIINGRSTQVTVIRVHGHPYIDLEALANAVNGSLSSGGNMIAMSVPIGPAPSASPTTAAAPADAPPAAPAPVPVSDHGFSRDFLNAGIEQMATLREWHTALQTAVQNGFPLSAGLLAPYRAQATTNLRYAQVAVSTPSDRSAFQLLNNEYQNMAKLSDKYVNARANLAYIAPDALDSDNLNQRIITCGHSLGAMAASGQFADDGSCSGS
jgi:hypothetical protein